MNINVWSGFSKRENSTKQPTSGTQITVTLKQNCSQESPVFIISSPMPNYDYVQAFGHYYWVTDIININAAQSEIHCKEDVLATYKADIGNTTAFILYDETSNTSLQDSRLSVVATPTISRNAAQLHNGLSTTGSIIATVTGQDATHCYVMGSSDIYKLIPNIKTQVENIFATDHAPTGILDQDFIPTIISAVRQLIASGDLATNIRDIRWVPFSVSGSGLFNVYNGMYDTGIDSGRLIVTGTNRIDARQINIAIPWQYTDWRKVYNTEIMVHIPFVGDVSYPAAQLADSDSLNFAVSLDMITGDIAIQVFTNTGLRIGSYGASTGVTIPIGNASPSLTKMVTTFLGGINPVGSIGNTLSHAAQAAGQMALAAFTPVSQTVGGLGSAASIGLPFNVEVATVCHNTNVSPSSVSSVMGTPTMAVKQIGNLSGYVQCENASVSSACKESERAAINSYLNNGFFYE